MLTYAYLFLVPICAYLPIFYQPTSTYEYLPKSTYLRIYEYLFKSTYLLFVRTCTYEYQNRGNKLIN